MFVKIFLINIRKIFWFIFYFVKILILFLDFFLMGKIFEGIVFGEEDIIIVGLIGEVMVLFLLVFLGCVGLVDVFLYGGNGGL